MIQDLSSKTQVTLEAFEQAPKKRGDIESFFLNEGFSLTGIDEVGRGCLAGPVFGGACILDYKKLLKLDAKSREQLRDSKKISAKIRQKMLLVIQEISLEAHVGAASVEEVESLGIVTATGLAVQRAMAEFKHPYDMILVDGRSSMPGLKGRQLPIIKGDDLCYVIAAASILAKEARDSHMREQAAIYPEYGFESHVGYGTKKHLEMIDKHGICPLHRKNFAPISDRLL